MTRRRPRRPLLTLVLLLAAGLVVGACGSDDDGGDGDEATDTTRPADVRVESDSEPQPGGRLVFGVEAETDGWNPTVNRWATSGITTANSVMDPLAAWNEDGQPEPYLAEEFVPNEDYTSWDIVLRDGVLFHDGTPLTADAVKRMLDAHIESQLSGPAFEPVASVEVVDELTARVAMSEPWAVFPTVLTAQVGLVPAPSMLDDPNGSENPVGTGPFVFEEWVPDNRFVATRNEDYWRTDADGNQLPYLDSVEYRPIPEVLSRMSALETGELDVTHTNDDEQIVDFRERAQAGEFQIVEDRGAGEESFILLNTAVAPLDDLRVRQALAHATDQEAFIEIVGSGILDAAKGPFNEQSPWYDEEAVSGYPSYDVAAAEALVEEYESEVGPIELVLGTPPISGNEDAVNVLEQQWEAVGIDVEIQTTEQGQYILDAVSGEYEANLWRQFGAPDPDADYVWWTSANANPVGELALNMARNQDPELDEALRQGRQNTDPEIRREAYATVQERLAADIPYVWLTHILWALVADNQVRNLAVVTLPDGQPGLGFVNGVSRVTEVWLEE